MNNRRWFVLAAAVLVWTPSPAAASFHFMQIEQVIGGVDGDMNKQAVQLRMRSSGQNLVSVARLVVRDAAGANPVILIDFEDDVDGFGSGARVLAASADFTTEPAITPDFTFTNLIPPSYLAAGSLTFEDDFGTIYWRLSWGGANYTGAGTGSFTNDGDGQFSPPFPDPLPSSSAQALLLKFAASAPSITNANDFALTPGAATFTNNNGDMGEVPSVVGTEPRPALAIALGAPYPNPTRQSLSYTVTVPSEARTRVALVDLAGRRVRELVDRTLPAGSHTLSWDGAGTVELAGGLYFLELAVGDERRVQRVVLLP